MTDGRQLQLSLAVIALLSLVVAAMGMESEPKSPETAALMGKLPLEFKTRGFSVHADFDRLAKDAEAKAALGDSGGDVLVG